MSEFQLEKGLMNPEMAEMCSVHSYKFSSVRSFVYNIAVIFNVVERD
jgi:hypothetical protein